MANVIVALIILSIIVLSISKIIIEKRKGMKCVGCHLSGSCPSNKSTEHKIAAQRIEIKQLM